MANFLERIVETYSCARQLMERISLSAGGSHSRGYGNSSRKFKSVEELGDAVARGEVGFGDRVSGKGWLSLYANWYLPGAYSPYRLSLQVAVNGPQWLVQMSPSPALLPAGQVPFQRNDLLLGFLYPSETPGFAIEIAPEEGESWAGTPIQKKSVDDNPWIFSLDTGNGSCHPTGFTEFYGDMSLASLMDNDDKKPGGDEEPCVNVLPDSALVRRAIRVPPLSQPIPIIFPPDFKQLIHSEIHFTAHISPLDSDVLSELSRLGNPLTEKAFALFGGDGGASGVSPFCLRVQGGSCSILPSEQVTSTKTELRSISHTTTDKANQQNNSKVVTLLVEWFFEDPRTGIPITFSDEELTEWFIPCAKNHVVAIDNYVLPLRWTGKLYGFDGPLYFYKTGPIEFSMTPSGLFAATHVVSLDDSFQYNWILWKETVTRLQRELIDKFRVMHGYSLILRTTYLTNWDWQGAFGNILEGRNAFVAAQNSLQGNQKVQLLMQELQKIHSNREEKKAMRKIKILFVSANPSGSKPLDLEIEIRDIREKIKLAEHRDLLEVEHVSAARPDDLLQAFNEHKVDILHFSGHGSPEGQLAFRGLDGKTQLVTKEAMSSLLRVLGQSVQVAVLNACHSHSQAEAIIEHIPCAVGMSASVGDKAAIIFAASFYRALAFGCDVQNAFDQGVVALQLDGISEDKTPQLLIKNGIDATQIIPVREDA